MSQVSRQRSDKIQAGLKASAGDVAAELDHLIIGINDNDTRLTAAESDIDDSEDLLTTVQRGLMEFADLGTGAVSLSDTTAGVSVLDGGTLTLTDPASYDNGYTKLILNESLGVRMSLSGLGFMFNAPDSVMVNPGALVRATVVAIGGTKYWHVAEGPGVLFKNVIAGGVDADIPPHARQHCVISNTGTVGGTIVMTLPIEPTLYMDDLDMMLSIDASPGLASVTLSSGVLGGTIFLDGANEGSSFTVSAGEYGYYNVRSFSTSATPDEPSVFVTTLRST
jgi:hypothetical protein